MPAFLEQDQESRMSQPTGQPATPAPTTGPTPAPAPGAPTAGPVAPPAAPAPAPTAQPAAPAAPQPGQPLYVPPGYMLVPAPGQAPAPTGPQYTPALPLPQAPAEPDQDPDWLARLPQRARKEIEDLRQENARRRVSERTAVVTQHGLAAAQQLGANPAALLGSVAWQQAAEQLDPTAADFPQRLTQTIQQIVAQAPWMASTPATPAPPPPPPPPVSSGGDFAGAGGAGTPITLEQLAKMSPAEIAQAHADGKLRHLM